MPSKPSPTRRAGRARGYLRGLTAGFALVLGLTGMPGAGAQLGFEAPISKFPQPTWGTNALTGEQLGKSGRIWDITEHNGVAYIAGEFTSVAPSVSLAGAIDGGSGLPLGGFPKVNGGVVTVSVPDGSGGWFVGGDFTSLNDFNAEGVAHILANGSVDTAWDASLAGANAQSQNGGALKVWALAKMGSYLYVGGEFTKFAPKTDPNTKQTIATGQTRPRIARVSAFTGTVDPNWNPGADSAVRSLAPSPDGRRVYVAGDFGILGGQPRAGLGAVNDFGAAEGWNPGAPGADAVVVSPDNSRIYVAGDGVKSFDNNGTQLFSVAGSGVRAMALSRNGSSLYLGGDFSSFGGAARKNLAALNALTGSLDPSWTPETNKGSTTDCGGSGLPAVAGVSVSDDGKKVFVGGCFTELKGKERKFLGAVDANTGTLEAWNPGANGAVTSLSVSGAQVYAGGNFKNLGGIPVTMLAAIDTHNGSATNWTPQIRNWDEKSGSPKPEPAMVQALALSPDKTKMYISGLFSAVLGPNGQWLKRDNLAQVNLSDGLAVPAFNPGAFQGAVRSLLMSGSRLYVGGDFTDIRISATDQAGSRRDRPCPAGHSDCHVITSTGGKDTGSTSWDRKGLVAAVDPNTGELDLDFGQSIDATEGSGLIGQSGKVCSGTSCGYGAVKGIAASADGQYLYIGGTFSKIKGPGLAGQLGLVALSLPAGTPTPWQPKIDIPAFGINICRCDGKSLLVAGGGAGGSVDRYMPHTGSTAPMWHHKTDGDSVAVDSSATTVYNAGHYDFIDSGTYKRKHASAYAASGEIAVNWDPELDTNTGPFTVEVLPKHVAFGGDFSRVNRVPQPGYAQFPGNP